MHIYKKSSVHCNAVLALPCTSEDPHVFQNLEAVKKPKTHLRKKGKYMCITLLQRMLQLLVCGTSNGQDFQQPLSCFLHLQLMPKYLIFLMLQQISWVISVLVLLWRLLKAWRKSILTGRLFLAEAHNSEAVRPRNQDPPSQV